MKNTKFLLIFICSFLLKTGLNATSEKQFNTQSEKYHVYLKNKKGVDFNPYTFFHLNAINRRLKEGLPLSDSTDFPLNTSYKEIIRNLTDSITNESRWFNMLTVYTSKTNAKLIGELTFVLKMEGSSLISESHFLSKENSSEYLNGTSKNNHYVPLLERVGRGKISVFRSAMNDLSTLKSGEQKLLEAQTSRLGGTFFRNAGLNGKGVIIAVFDAGFPSVDKLDAFKHLVQNNQILNTFDFVKKKKDVYDFGVHGTMVLSCIAGIYEGVQMGLASGASFLLARTEYPKQEPESEEENWLAAAEWADKEGADVINSSLGYTYHRYFYENMDGKTSLVAKAANMAARKGILVVNAAGNDGDSKWHFINTPADADSVLAVGGTNPYSDYKLDFSSFGPTKDSRIKPNVCAFGIAIGQGKKNIMAVPGTSFASPLVAGFAACVKQLYPELNNMELFHEIEKSGHLYPYFDYGHGYGIPQAEYFINKRNKKTVDATFKIVKDTTEIKLFLRKDILKNSKHPLNLYFHIQENNGFLRNYGVMVIKYHLVGNDSLQIAEIETGIFDSKEIIIPENYFPAEGEKLRIHFEGYTEEIY